MPVNQSNILLLDDAVTTGASIREALPEYLRCRAGRRAFCNRRRISSRMVSYLCYGRNGHTEGKEGREALQQG